MKKECLMRYRLVCSKCFRICFHSPGKDLLAHISVYDWNLPHSSDVALQLQSVTKSTCTFVDKVCRRDPYQLDEVAERTLPLLGGAALYVRSQGDSSKIDSRAPDRPQSLSWERLNVLWRYIVA